MEWFLFYIILAIVFYLIALSQLYRFWKGASRIKIGDTLTNELIAEARKRIIIIIILIVAGAVFNVIGIMIRP